MSLEKHVLGWQHIGIPVSNMDQSEKFYESLGFQRAYRTDYCGQKVSFMRLGEMTIELYMLKKTAKTAGAIDHIAINVSNIEEVFRIIREGSYIMLDSEIDERPFWDRGVRFFTIVGPSGEKVEFNQYM